MSFGKAIAFVVSSFVVVVVGTAVLNRARRFIPLIDTVLG